MAASEHVKMLEERREIRREFVLAGGFPVAEDSRRGRRFDEWLIQEREAARQEGLEQGWDERDRGDVMLPVNPPKWRGNPYRRTHGNED